MAASLVAYAAADALGGSWPISEATFLTDSTNEGMARIAAELGTAEKPGKLYSVLLR